LPDLPWIAIDDLHRCLGLNREQRKFMRREFERGWGHSETIATPGGRTIIVPHYLAQAAIGAAVHRGMASEAVETVYAIAFAEALPKLMPAHLGFPSAKRAIEAIR
jgi:hypothetical protein